MNHWKINKSFKNSQILLNFIWVILKIIIYQNKTAYKHDFLMFKQILNSIIISNTHLKYLLWYLVYFIAKYHQLSIKTAIQNPLKFNSHMYSEPHIIFIGIICWYHKIMKQLKTYAFNRFNLNNPNI